MIMKNLLITFFTVLFCLTSSIGWSLTLDDLVLREGVYYKKFTDVPFSGNVTGKEQGLVKNGKLEGLWFGYWDNGQLWYKGNYKNGKMDGSWINYYDNGQLISKNWMKNDKLEGYFITYNEDGSVWKKETYKNGKKNSD